MNMHGIFQLSLTITDGDTGEAKTIAGLPVLKGMPREARVSVLAKALDELFHAIDPPTQDQQ